jgi:glucosamine--fructose-6-phosphate aminotransferase (isomerizing)
MAGSQMWAEMLEQPAVLRHLGDRRGALLPSLRAAIPPQLAGSVLVARGSSDHAAVYGRYLLEMASHRPVALAAPSLHTLYGASTDYGGYLAVAISQSGRTPEITTLLDRLQAAGARGVAITNDPSSPLATAAIAVIDLDAGDELAVPATKTLTAQMAAFCVMAEAFGLAFGDDGWRALADGVEEVLDDDRPSQSVAAAIGDAPALLAVGRGFHMSAALETALKLKETTGIAAEGYSTADLRHGPVAIVGDEFPVLAFTSSGPAAADVEALVADLRVRRARVWVVGDGEGADLPIPAGLPEQIAPIVAVVRGQQIARHLALIRGIDPDRHLGLSKVAITR